MSRIDYHGTPVDVVSQTALQVLRDRGGQTIARDLRDAAGVDQNEQIHYRMRNHLIPAGLAEKADERVEQAGNAPDAIVYKLTDEGRAFLDEHAEDLTKAVDAARATESLERVRETVDTFDGRLTDVESDMERLQNRTDKQFNRWSSQIGRFSDRVSRVQKEIDQKAERDHAENTRDSLNDLWDEHETLKQRVRDLGDDLKDDLSDNRHDIKGLELTIGQLERRVKSDQKRIDELANELEKARREARAAHREANKGPFTQIYESLLGE